MTSGLPTHPWEALQKPGVAATDAPPAARSLAFVAGDEAGFDLRLALPPVCLKCGATEDVQHVDEKLRLQLDKMAHAIGIASGEGFRPGLAPGDYRLRLPLCGRCAARAERARKLRLALAISPAWLVGGVLLLALVGGWIGSLGAGILIVSVPVLAVVSYIARSNSLLTVAVDGDGFVKLAGVHPDAGAAIAKAAGLE